MRRPWGPIVLLTLFGAFAAASFSAASSADGVDPFYERLFQDGMLALSTGDGDGASRQLELACFGMLDAPRRLAECLTGLATAQANLERREDFLSTLSRILEVERRFTGYSGAQINPKLRRSFEVGVEQWAPPESLAGFAAFADIADRQNAARLRRLPTAERREQLDGLIAQAPTKALWRRMEIEIEIESENFPRAAELTESWSPQDGDIRCLRGRAQFGLGSCDARTLSDLESCVAPDARQASVSLLDCHVQLSDRVSGDAVYAAMDQDVRQDRRVRRLARQLRRLERTAPEGAAGSAAGTETPSGGEAGAGTEPSPEPATAPQKPTAGTAPGSQPTQEQLATLERGWQTLRADDRSRFTTTFATVTDLAQQYAGWAEAQHLAAELAYRLSRWQDAVSYFERAEAASPLQPDQEFYLAVALFKSGRQAAAEDRLERCLPSIQPSDFVRFWSERIREGG